jgi:hypothetical protein
MPVVVRASNGVLKDIVDYWGAGKATWEPEMIRVLTLLVLAEWDQDTPLYMAQGVFANLVNARRSRAGARTRVRKCVTGGERPRSEGLLAHEPIH